MNFMSPNKKPFQSHSTTGHYFFACMLALPHLYVTTIDFFCMLDHRPTLQDQCERTLISGAVMFTYRAGDHHGFLHHGKEGKRAHILVTS